VATSSPTARYSAWIVINELSTKGPNLIAKETKVSEEFIEQSPSYSDSPKDKSEEPDEDDQQYHQHDL
jgi:hypothetical protein